MSECEIPEFYSTVDRLARKRHDCCECRAPIEPGELYLRITAKWEGVIESYAQHQLCAEACMYVRDNIAMDCLYFGELREFLGDDWEWRDRHQHKKMRNMVARIWRRERAAAAKPE